MGLLHSKENENVELAKQMLSFGLDINQVCEITNISKEEAKKIINKLKEEQGS